MSYEREHRGELAPERERPPISMGAYSRASEKRSSGENQDSYFIDSRVSAAGVFDGVGSAEHPLLASRLANQAVEKELASFDASLTVSRAEVAMHETLYRAHETLIEHAAEEDDLRTTGTILKIFETDPGDWFAVTATVGDSRSYLMTSGAFDQLTTDHSVLPSDPFEAWQVQDRFDNLTDPATLRDEDRKFWENRHKVTSVLGQPKPPSIRVSSAEVHEGDRLLLTTDGIHDNLTKREIASIMAGHRSPEHTAQELVQAALNRSRDRGHLRAKRDDMTAAVLRVG
jgi:PPM family protein phosphatase